METARVQLDFLVRVHDLERVVLISHHGCAWYGQHLEMTPDECLPAQVDDLSHAAATLHDWHPGLHIDAYLAMRTHHWFTFHKVPVFAAAPVMPNDSRPNQLSKGETRIN